MLCEGITKQLLASALLAGAATLALGAPSATREWHPAALWAPVEAQTGAAELWTDVDLLQPAQLASLLASPKEEKPLTFCVGFQGLYRSAHIPGAEFHGPASTPEGLQNLRQRVAGLPRSRAIVIYCGCCPLQHCPNARPAFRTLHQMGFRQVRALSLPKDFATDWMGKGYPVQKGK
jgi:thiosulfate/3-mercaptopyruvate sulfurtransferase